MSDLIVYVNEEAVDLEEGQVVAITKQAAKVGDFNKVLADGTNQVTIPATANNKRILSNSQLVQTESEIPYSRLSAKLVQEGFETIQDGFAIIETAGVDNYNLQLVGGNASFFNLIKDKNLRDLDLKEFNHFWTNQNVFDNRNNTEGFIYSLFEQTSVDIDTTEMTLATAIFNDYKVKTQFLLPSFYVKTLVERIFSEIGFDFQGDILSNSIYNNLVLFKGEDWNRGTSADWLSFTIVRSTDINLIGLGFTIQPFPLSDLTQEETVYWSDALIAEFYLPDNVTANLEMTFNFFNNDVIAQDVFLSIPYSTQAGSVTIAHTFTLPVGASQHSFSTSFDCIQNEGNFDCKFLIYMEGDLLVDVLIGSSLVADFIFISSLPVTTRRNALSFITGVTPVPDMLQTDFLKEIAKVFQLVFYTDALDKIVTAERFDKVIENIPLAIDLSEKIDDTSAQINFHIDGYAQTNFLQWKEDDISKFTGKGIINVADVSLPIERKLVEMSRFAASSTVERFDTKSVPFVPVFGEVLPNGTPTNGMTDRLLIVRQEVFPYTINFYQNGVDIPTDTVTFAYFTEADNADSLDFPTLIENFYKSIIAMTTKAKTVNASFKITAAEVYSYNPFLPVYIQKYNSYFYLEKIENYLNGKLTKLKLIKL